MMGLSTTEQITTASHDLYTRAMVKAIQRLQY